jgi:uncharacterized protein (DUF983 family)
VNYGLTRRLRALLLQRCPRCLRGQVFSGLTSMRESCPVCAHRFEREPGYFIGALYASYFLAVPILVLLTFLIHWLFLPHWRLHYVALVAVLPYLLLVPIVFRYSRLIWMHIDYPPPADE